MANNAMQIVVFGALAVVIAMAIVIFFPVDCTVSNKVEGFAVQPGPKVCPSGTKMYIDKDGNTNCCEGEVVGSRCEGPINCTFSSGGQNGIPFCGQGRLRRYDGEIWPMVKQLFASSRMTPRETFEKVVLVKFGELGNLLRQNVPNTISPKTLQAFGDIGFDSNKLWFERLDDLYTPKDLKEPAIYEEETMRMITKVMDLLQKEPIAKDPLKLAAKIQQETCKK